MKFIKSIMRRSLVFLSLVATLYLANVAQAADNQRFILQSPAPYDGLVAAVEALGGEVTYQYKNIGAVAVVVPTGRSSELLSIDGVTAAYKDRSIGSPQPAEIIDIDASEILGVMDAYQMQGLVGSLPQDYLSDNILTGASTLHGEGIGGAGVVVAIIDSGTANNPAVVPSIAGAVIGGENFVPGPEEPSATSTFNDSHGTWVGSTIAANVGFLFANGGALVTALLAYDPASVIFDIIPGASLVPMVGSAPLADLYAMKVFSAFGGGSPNSRVIAAMDRAITLRSNYNSGMPSVPVSGDGSEEDPFVYDSLRIEIVNMSLGGGTVFAGGDLESEVTEAMLDVGITLVASAGNEGFAAMTGGSPGTGKGSLTVGASNLVNHERVLRDLQFGPGIGGFYRASDHHQTAFFSSRGPTADGRIDPDVSANGFANFAQGAGGGLSVVSGTSFSAPTTAGAAALLREAVPGASATDIRDALIATANPAIVGDGSADIDQGAGFIDVAAARDSLVNGKKGSKKKGSKKKGSKKKKTSKKVRKNVEQAGFDVQKCDANGFSMSFADLLPGQVAHTFIDTKDDISQINITVSNIVPALPPPAQNLFFGDDIFFTVQDAVTSDLSEPFPGGLFLFADTSLVFDNPQTGVVRLATMGDWTNAGNISADLDVSCVKTPRGRKTAEGKIAEGDFDFVSVDVPAGTAEVVFETSWKNNWGRYPTDDIDMFLLPPLGEPNFDGATLDSPERVELAAPMAGTWTVIVNGFTVSEDGKDSKWELRVTADGVRLDEM
jgi:hypothetical protein